MAIDGNVYSGSEVQVGFAQESTFGTVTADSGAFVQLAEFGSISFDKGLTQKLEMKNRGSRVANIDDKYITEAGGTRKFTISDIPVRRTDLAELLYAVLQNVSEGATTPYTKTFNLLLSSQPDFSSSAGYFATMGAKLPLSGRDIKLTSCIASNLALKSDIVSGDGRLMASVDFISGFSSSVAATFSGTWTIASQNYFDFGSPATATLDGNDLVLYSWELAINNNAKRQGNDSNGNAQTYSVAIPELEVTGSLTVKYDSNVAAVMADYIAGNEKPIVLEVGTAGAAGHFKLDLQDTIYTGPNLDLGDEIKLTVPFKMLYDGSNTSTITVSDGVDQAW